MLLVIESPNKAKKLQNILGPGYEIVATCGHLIDLPPKTLGVDLITYEPDLSPLKKDSVEALKKAIRRHDEILIATDPDREGEAIAAHVASFIPAPKMYYRVRFNSITRDAVLRAIQQKGPLDHKLCDAQKARRVTDRLIGYQISPIMWKNGLLGSSAGRVQSVVLGYIVQREREIQNFVPTEYWDAGIVLPEGLAHLVSVDGEKVKISSAQDAEIFRSHLGSNNEVQISRIDKSVRIRKPDPPFTTATLQQSAHSVLGWKVDKTMKVAQGLFEQGVITYIRTDSVSIDPGKAAVIRDDILSRYGSKYVGNPTHLDKASSQAAHEAIRPTFDHAVSDLSSDDQKLYQLIHDRCIASQMSEARYNTTTVELKVLNIDKDIRFEIKGVVLIFDGYSRVQKVSQKDQVLPDAWQEGQALKFISAHLEKKSTQPPPRYSEATVIKKMETDGVGRPATYAATLKHLVDKNYVEDNRVLTPTDTGNLIYDYLEANFHDIVDPKYTSDLEVNLDRVADGGLGYYDCVNGLQTSILSSIDKAARSTVDSVYKCPVCQQGNIERKIARKGQSKGQVFYSCSRYPTCKTITDEQGRESDLESGIDPCPECGSATVKRKSKMGVFFGCSRYPSCKGILRDSSKSTTSQHPCGYCGGSTVVLKSKFGQFLKCEVCSQIHGIPVGKCPVDGGYLVHKKSKKNEIFVSCMNYPNCKYTVN